MNQNFGVDQEDFKSKELTPYITAAEENGFVLDIVGGEQFGFLIPNGKIITSEKYQSHNALAKHLGFKDKVEAMEAGMVRVSHSDQHMSYEVAYGNTQGYEQINYSIYQNVASDKWTPIVNIIIDFIGCDPITFKVDEIAERSYDIKNFLIDDSRALLGMVKLLNSEKGYCFIAPSSGGNDVFLDFSDIKNNDCRELRDGDRVFYEVMTHEKRGKHAINVRLK
jgi:CspA family cold shock protein